MSIKAENLSLDMPEIFVIPTSIYSTPWISGYIHPLPLPSWPSGLVQATGHQATFPSVAVPCREV
jgi:hypothetical protein